MVTTHTCMHICWIVDRNYYLITFLCRQHKNKRINQINFQSYWFYSNILRNSLSKLITQILFLHFYQLKYPKISDVYLKCTASHFVWTTAATRRDLESTICWHRCVGISFQTRSKLSLIELCLLSKVVVNLVSSTTYPIYAHAWFNSS